jgi:hypothetical protein
MALEKLNLICDQGLVHGTIVDIEMIDTRVRAQLAQGRAARGGDCRTGSGDAISLSYADEPRAMQPCRLTSGSVGPTEKPTRGDPIAPSRILAGRDDAAPSLLSARRVDEGGLVWLADGGNVPAPDRREDHLGGYRRRRAVGLAHDVEKGNLADRGSNARVLGSGRQGVPPAHRGSEGHDTGHIDSRQGAGERDRRPPVLQLHTWIEEVGFSLTVTETSVVEDERGESLRRESLGEGTKPITPRPRQSVSHDDRGRSLCAAGS